MVCGAAMAKKRTNDTVSDAEAERRATDALRRALTTPHKPQKAMVGKADGRTKRKKRKP